MRIGITVWEGAVANTCDFAKELLVGDDGEEPRTIPVPRLTDVWALAAWFADRGISRLVCGAVSRCLEEALVARGIAVTGFVMGDAAEVLAACRAGALDGRYAMPRRHRRRRRGAGGRRGG